MKRFLGIIILGLFVCSYASAGSSEYKQWQKYQKQYPTLKSVMVYGVEKEQNYMGADWTYSEATPSVKDYCRKDGNQTCILKYEGNNYVYDREVKEEKIAKKKVELASMIDDAKKTCKDLGFKEGTEKFSDCSLKLYSQSVELAAKNNQTVVMQPQSSGSNVMTIYDPVRDSRALMRQGQRMLSGGCTLGINC